MQTNVNTRCYNEFLDKQARIMKYISCYSFSIFVQKYNKQNLLVISCKFYWRLQKKCLIGTNFELFCCIRFRVRWKDLLNSVTNAMTGACWWYIQFNSVVWWMFRVMFQWQYHEWKVSCLNEAFYNKCIVFLQRMVLHCMIFIFKANMKLKSTYY